MSFLAVVVVVVDIIVVANPLKSCERRNQILLLDYYLLRLNNVI
jgi:hypothetical protein